MVFTDGSPAPGGGVFAFSGADELMLRGNQELFLLSEQQGPLKRVLSKTDLTTMSSASLLEEGQLVNGLTVGPILRSSASQNALHWVAVTEQNGDDALVVDGSFFLGTARGSVQPQFFVDASINNEGKIAVLLWEEQPPTRGVAAVALPFSSLASEDRVGEIELLDMVPSNIAFSEGGEVVTTWFLADPDFEFMVLFCADPSPPGGEGPPSMEERVLLSGDRLDTNDDGIADATVVAIDASAGAAPEVSRDGELLVRVELQLDSSPTTTLDALIRIYVGGCPLFSDGFESGDTSQW